MSASLSVLKSAALLLSLQLVQRGLGIVSTLILARLLVPAEFGIVALVTISMQFFELLVETGNQQYIVQKKTLVDDDLNTAWSMDVLLKSLLALLIIAASPLLAIYFRTPELTAALSVTALTLPIRALKTPGLMKLARDINYRPIFRLNLWQKIITFIVVIGLALAHPSYWALIAGNIVSACILAIGSYRVDAYRPRWTLVNFREQWGFSQWLLLRGIVGFTRSQIDNLMVSRFFGTTPLGGYNVVREVSLLPALSAIIPMSEPLLAAIAKAKEDPATLAHRIRFSLAVMSSCLIPVTLFIMMYPKLIVGVLLGDNWTAYAPLLRPFGLLFFTFCLFALVSDAIIALGKVYRLFWFDVISTVIIFVTLLLTGTHSLTAMAWSRGWLAIATTLALLLILARMTRFGLARYCWLTLPSLIGSAGAGYLIAQCPLQALPPVVEFLLRGAGFVLIAVATTLIWASLLLRNTEEWHQIRFLLKHVIRRKKPSP
ncbi:oligosaccharide flippase family protein [Mangrovitalea sediminis]|uniref:oligosaccharide flippase family protein n=1 Tax=Mangrovitalea sediminis TaxID=1982043 RepID=UPI000BE4FA83|nr:oligosaccharide flippase family protein [Mangrovitalea sediminis]